jgi:hypothetical protein
MNKLEKIIQELEEYEIAYTDLVSWGQINDIETISKFRDWYTYAIKVFYNYVGENDSSFQTFKTETLQAMAFVCWMFLTHSNQIIQFSKKK